MVNTSVLPNDLSLFYSHSAIQYLGPRYDVLIFLVSACEPNFNFKSFPKLKVQRLFQQLIFLSKLLAG